MQQVHSLAGRSEHVQVEQQHGHDRLGQLIGIYRIAVDTIVASQVEDLSQDGHEVHYRGQSHSAHQRKCSRGACDMEWQYGQCSAQVDHVGLPQV